jgi:hypothetical protein
MDRLKQSTVLTQGEVIWRDLEPPMIAFGTKPRPGPLDYRVTYRFDVEGRRFTKDEIVTDEIYQRAHLYSPVAVQFVKDNPAISRIVGNVPHAPFDATVFVLFFIVLLLVIFLPGKMKGT